MLKFLKRDSWNPYFIGLSLGILNTLLFSLGHHIGACGAYTRIAAIFQYFLFPDSIKITSYFYKVISNSPILNWSILFLIGIMIGSFFSVKMKKKQSVKEEIWIKNFGNSNIKRALSAFFGGMLLILGSRIAGGCTSWHTLGGIAKLSVVGVLFTISFIATGIIAAKLIYRR